MNKFYNLLQLLVKEPDIAVENVVKEQKSNVGLIIAFVGILSFSISSYFAKITLGTFYFDNFVEEILKVLINTIIYYFIYVGITFSTCKLLKGKGNFLKYSKLIGWSFLPMITIALTMNIVLLGSYLLRAYNSFDLIIKLVIFTLIISTFYQVFISLQITSRLFRSLMNLSKKKSILTYWMTLIPLFIIFDIIF